MAIINQIQGVIEKRFKQQLNRKRSGSRFPMNYTGSLQNSIKSTVIESNGFEILTLEALWYGQRLNDGYKTEINLQSGKGANPGSGYINGLTDWLMTKKGLSFKAAKKMAFAIANSKADANSKNPGVSFSPSNRGWIDEIKEDVDKEINNIIFAETQQTVQQKVDSVLNITIP
jgi:hypothetical protein